MDRIDFYKIYCAFVQLIDLYEQDRLSENTVRNMIKELDVMKTNELIPEFIPMLLRIQTLRSWYHCEAIKD